MDAHNLRVRALESFSKFLRYEDALDLENACYDIAHVNNSPYARPFRRAMYALQNSAGFDTKVRAHGALRAMAYKDRELFAADSELTRAVEREHQVEMYKALLVDLTKNDIQLGQEGGVRCAKCRSTDVSFSFLQMRSADEGCSVFCSCDKCGKRWKLN